MQPRAFLWPSSCPWLGTSPGERVPILFSAQNSLKKWSSDDNTYSRDVSPSCLCWGCPDANHKLASPVPSSQGPLPLVDLPETWAGLAWGTLFLSGWPEPGKSPPHLLFWHISAPWREGEMDTAVARRRRRNDFLPPVVLMSASPGQSILTGRAPRGPVISSVTGITLTILCFWGLLFFFPSTFSSCFAFHFIFTKALKKRKGREVWLWKWGPGVRLHCSFLHSESANAYCSPCAHRPLLTSPHHVLSLQSTPVLWASIPPHSAPKLLTKVTVKPEAFRLDLGWNDSSTSHELCDITTLSFCFFLVRCGGQYLVHTGMVRTEWWDTHERLLHIHMSWLLVSCARHYASCWGKFRP